MPLLTNHQVQAARLAFGEGLRRTRRDRGWSQEELAERSGLHRNYIGGIERGERNVGIDNIHRLAAALELEPRRLFA